MTQPLLHDSQRAELEEQIQAFLSEGGEITEVPQGKTAAAEAAKSQWARSTDRPAPAKS